ncbi:ComEC/Rec2 family competence protein [Burkholderia sp. FERM BP-3421]|uniref:ComEC/Rec2 family competence protein n=1 Tax=Burkholderia sp. FERM BP-3421 TaxID=1494466 RepID=UPI00236132F4|nr:ComEC/Rec2 family competence protein [Burkholderia sp. FERM BP-3421]WDD94557.1 ComEC/Rec2 family competence protein [Burkholderia sp. FERM BP-3421]
MRTRVLAFALGIVWLQGQAALPGALAWVAGSALAGGLAAGAAWLARGEAGAGGRWRRRAAGVALCAAVCLAGAGYAACRAYARLAVTLPANWEGRDLTVTGVVRGLPARGPDGVRFLLAVESIEADGARARFPARVALAWIVRGAAPAPPTLTPGERWRLVVRLRRPHGNANFGVRDAEAGWLARDIRARGYVSVPQAARRLPGRPARQAVIERARAALDARIGAVLGDAPHRGIVAALAIGAQHGIRAADWQVLRATGTSHLVAISGLHIGIVGGLCGGLAAAGWRRARGFGRDAPLIAAAQQVGALGALLGAAGYAALAGFNVPAQRAWWMLAAVSVAYLSGRRVAPSAVLAFALGCVLLADPWAVLAPGFWLSFGAVAAILFVVSGRFGPAREPAEREAAEHGGRCWRAGAWRGLARRAAQAARTQYAVTVALAPLTLLWFSQIPLLGPVANAFAIPWVSLVVAPTVLVGVVLPAPLDALAFRLAHLLVAGMMRAGAWLADAPGALWWLPAPDGRVLALAAAGTLWALAPRGWPLRWAAPLAWLPCLAPPPSAPPPGAFRLTVLDVGQGGAALVETARHSLLFDAGPGPEATHAGERIVAPYLRSRGIAALDALVLSHADADHAGGAPAVLGALPVRQLVGELPPAHPLWQTAQAAGAARLPCVAGQRWHWDGVEFAMLWPERGPGAAGTNGRSCVLRVAAGAQAALLTGDIDARAERRLVARDRAALAAQVLLVPHHGSRTASTEPFLDSVAPRIAVFQVGYANRFRHPHPTVWARYLGRAIALPRTDQDGAVRIEVRAGAADGLELERYRDAHRRYWMDR